MKKIKAILWLLFVETPFFITGGLEMIILLDRKVVGHSYEIKRFPSTKKKKAAIDMKTAVNYLERCNKQFKD